MNLSRVEKETGHGGPEGGAAPGAGSAGGVPESRRLAHPAEAVAGRPGPRGGAQTTAGSAPPAGKRGQPQRGSHDRPVGGGIEPPAPRSGGRRAQKERRGVLSLCERKE